MTAAQFAVRVNGRRSGEGYRALCPAHDDDKPSLSITDAENGKLLVNCHAGCSPQEIVEAVGLSEQDLFNDEPRAGTDSARSGDGRDALGQIEAKYAYRDEEGNLLYEVVRTLAKTFPQRQPGGPRGWIWNTTGVRRVLYRLPELIAAVKAGKRICIVEGEKDVDRLVEHGLAATCNPGGAGKWIAAYSDHLSGARVAVLPDNDGPGRKHAEDVARSLRGVAREIKVVALPGLAEKGDVSDWLDGGGTTEELERLVDEAPVWQAPLSRFALKTVRELEARPPREWLVEGILQAGSLAELHGKPGVGKTFLALSLAGSISTGFPFFGHEVVKQGFVVYVAAEGDQSLPPRLRAWRKFHREDERPGLRVIPESVNLGKSTEVEELIAQLRTLPESPVLVVIDTLARCMVGGDESSAKDMGLVVHATELIRTAVGATVLLVHHPGHDSSRERGSSALRGAADTMMALKEGRATIDLVCEKQKDSAPFEPVHLEFVAQGDSLVMVPAGSGAGQSEEDLTEQQQQALQALARAQGGLTATGWKEATGVEGSSFYNCRKKLVRLRLVEGGGGPGQLYRLSHRGKEVITPSSNITPK